MTNLSGNLDSLIFRQARSGADLEGATGLLGVAFEPAVDRLARAMYDHCPGSERPRCFVAVDPAAAGVVATVMLLPKLWAIEGVALRVAEAEFVATDPAYRNSGFQRRLFALFEQDAKAEGYTLSAVMGITSFYDRFGYSFALPAGYSLTMAAAEVARAVEDDPFRNKERRLSVRPAVAADAPAMLALWQERDEGLQFREVQDLDHWRHYLGDLAGMDIIRGKWYLVEETPAPAGRVAAGFGFHPAGGTHQMVTLRSVDHTATLEAIRWAAEETLRQQGQRLWLALRPGSSEHASAAGLGARPERPFGWQMRIIDRAGFLTALRPALERRLAASAFRGLEADLTLDLYRSQLVLRWRGGRLAEVTENPGVLASSEMRPRLPEDAFVKLALGHRTLEELRAERIEVGIPRQHRALLEVLFPKLEGWVDL